jgi:UDP-N-acetylglucosamine 4,6-dehydratase
MNLMELAKAIASDSDIKLVGIRPGEKLHEVLVSEDEACRTLDCGDMFVIRPSFSWWEDNNWSQGATPPSGFRYASDSNTQWLSIEDLRRLVGEPAESGQVAARA